MSLLERLGLLMESRELKIYALFYPFLTSRLLDLTRTCWTHWYRIMFLGMMLRFLLGE